MQARKSLLMISMTVVLIAGCSKPQSETDAAAAPQTPVGSAAAMSADTTAPVDAAHTVPAQAYVAAAAAFDISSIPVSDNPLPEWPYVALPAGYEFESAGSIARSSKDLARVPVWTGGELLWLEGRTFSDGIDNSEDKSFSKFEVRKNIQKAVEALGGVRVAEHSIDKTTYKTNEKALDDFRHEFSKIGDAYVYDNDADTYLIRRADKAIWVVAEFSNSDAGLMVAEGPLPQPAKK